MKFKDYLKDKAYLIVITLLVIITLDVFLVLISIKTEVIVIIDIAILSVFISAFGVEFSRRKHYYKNMAEVLDNLDEKYLIYDFMEKSSFLDGEIMKDIIRQSNFSMTQQVSMYKESQENYKNYIELWIHEIKTPLSALKLIVDNNKELGYISEEIEAINHFVEQALYYARSTSVYKDYVVSEVDLHKVVTSAIKQLSTSFIKKDINIVLELDESTVYSDPKWLEFMIKQVLLNSIKYSYKHGEITIRSIKQEQSVRFEIIDHGIGINKSDIGRVFDLGFTGSSGRVYNQATGIGLYLVKQLADALSITVGIESSDGTTVSFIFPQSDMHFRV